MNESDFRKIIKNNKDRVYNTCLGLLQHSEDAEDIAQDVFVEVYQKLDSFKGHSSLSTWIYRIAVNKSLEHIRKHKTLKRGATTIPIEYVVGSGDFNHPGVQLENKEMAAHLFKLIGKLPEDQRTAFSLNKVEGLAYREIADIMQRTLPSIESLIHRAKTKLKQEFQKND